MASLGLSLPLSPPRCLLHPAGMGRLFSRVSQSLCFANRRRCVPAGQFFLALPQFKKAPSDCSQGPRASPYPKQCRPLLSVPPPLAGGGCGRQGYFSAGSKHLLISWLQSPSAVILEPPKIKSTIISTVSASVCHEVMGLNAMVSFLNVEL